MHNSLLFFPRSRRCIIKFCGKPYSMKVVLNILLFVVFHYLLHGVRSICGDATCLMDCILVYTHDNPDGKQEARITTTIMLLWNVVLKIEYGGSAFEWDLNYMHHNRMFDISYRIRMEIRNTTLLVATIDFPQFNYCLGIPSLNIPFYIDGNNIEWAE